MSAGGGGSNPHLFSKWDPTADLMNQLVAAKRDAQDFHRRYE